MATTSSATGGGTSASELGESFLDTTQTSDMGTFPGDQESSLFMTASTIPLTSLILIQFTFTRRENYFFNIN